MTMVKSFESGADLDDHLSHFRVDHLVKFVRGRLRLASIIYRSSGSNDGLVSGLVCCLLRVAIMSVDHRHSIRTISLSSA